MPNDDDAPALFCKPPSALLPTPILNPHVPLRTSNPPLKTTTTKKPNSIPRTKVAGCNACDPIIPVPTKASKQPTHVCTACGGTAFNKDAYLPTYDTGTKRCPCNVNYGQDINVQSLVTASLDTTRPSAERKKLAKQAAAFKGIFAAGIAGGVCLPCPAKPDLLAQTYASPGGLLPAATCAPVVPPPP
jgi:hypothetical protein